MYLIFDLTSCIVLSLCLCQSSSLFWISFDTFSTVISPSIFLGVWMGGEQLSRHYGSPAGDLLQPR